MFVHSGVLHIALKAGLPGLVLLGGLGWACMRASRTALRQGAANAADGAPANVAVLALATAGVAGLAFMLPDILVGTPVPQVRTSQMLAICMACPYIALQAARHANAQAHLAATTAPAHPAAPADTPAATPAATPATPAAAPP